MSSLKVVGIGIQLVTHVTLQASQAIENADDVFYLTADCASDYWIKKFEIRIPNPCIRSIPLKHPELIRTNSDGGRGH